MSDDLGLENTPKDKTANSSLDVPTRSDSIEAIPKPNLGSPLEPPRLGTPVKVADRPHRWTIALSLLAATISIISAAFSLLSLNETRENRRINEQTARAYLRPTSLVLDASLFSSENWEHRSLTGSLTITNTGRVAAQTISVLLDTNPPRDETLFEIARFAELPPGSTNTVRIIMRMTNSKSMTQLDDSKEYVFGLRIRYLDGVNPDLKTDESTFCMSMDKAKAKGMISLYPCDAHFSGFDSVTPSSIQH
jgi:hypothetical protein